jgi:calcineurin-like phosphoesterase family protein
MNIYLTADTHFDHFNIIEYTNRPFSCAKEMNEALIQRWNELVKDNDCVYHLGDFCISRDPKRWAQFLHRLNGKIHLVRGNHDYNKPVNNIINEPGISKKLIWIKDYYKLLIGNKEKQSIILMHYALRVWDRSHHGSMHCHGHSHGELPEDSVARSMDVGVDTNNYYPYSYEEVRDKLLKKTGYTTKR